MKFKNVVLVVKDIEHSTRFYKEIFGLEILTEFTELVIMSEGLVLQKEGAWEELLRLKTAYGGHNVALYFEERNMDEFAKKLEKSSFNIHYIYPLEENVWGQKMMCIYDPDMNIIHIKEPLEFDVRKVTE